MISKATKAKMESLGCHYAEEKPRDLSRRKRPVAYSPQPSDLVPCTLCRGSGKIKSIVADRIIKCQMCDGKGKVTYRRIAAMRHYRRKGSQAIRRSRTRTRTVRGQS